MKYNRMNRQEKKADQKARMAESLHGSGVYVFQNNTKGDLNLPKATASGKRNLKVGEEFQGDSYFIKLVPQMLKCIRCITPPQPFQQENNAMQEEKLILNQPDQVTEQGTVEHVKCQKKQALNEGTPPTKCCQQPVLLTEDPMEGVEIILRD